MAQARHDWNKATPEGPPSPIAASPRERARAVARTPGATETMAQFVRANRQGRANADAIPHKTAVKTRYGAEAEAMRNANRLTPEAKKRLERVRGQKPKARPVARNQGKLSA